MICCSCSVEFLKLDEGIVSSHAVSTTELSALLCSHGVRNVILNACQSASDRGSRSNLARCLVQSGIENAVGMAFKVTDIATSIFLRVLYQQYLQKRLSLVQAASYARRALLLKPQRASRYGTHINLMDYLLPIVYSSSTSVSPEKILGSLTAYTGIRSPFQLIGREADLLAIETDVAAGCRCIRLKGPPGIGKTSLILHAVRWWEMTGFATCKHVHTNLGQDISEIEMAACESLETTSKGGFPSTHSKLSVIVFDSLDELRFAPDTNVKDAIRRFRWLIKRLLSFENVCIILVANEDTIFGNLYLRLRNIEDSIHVLGPPDRNFWVRIALQILQGISTSLDLHDTREMFYFERSIELSRGNPLAIQLLARSFCTELLRPEDFYWKLVGSDSIRLDFDWAAQSEGANYLMGLRTVFGDLDRAPLTEQVCTHLYLTYFWHYLPPDLLVYRYFLCRALVDYQKMNQTLGPCWLPITWWDLPKFLANVIYDLLLGTPTRLQLRLLSEQPRTWEHRKQKYPEEDKLVCDALFGAKTDDTGFGLVWDEEFQIEKDRVEAMLDLRILSRGYNAHINSTGLKNFEQHLLIHPVATLYLKDRIKVLNPRLKRVMEKAFIYFQSYRFQKFNCDENEGSESYLQMSRRLEAEFENIMTAAHIGLHQNYRSPPGFGHPYGMTASYWQSVPENQSQILLDYFPAALDRINTELTSPYQSIIGCLRRLVSRILQLCENSAVLQEYRKILLVAEFQNIEWLSSQIARRLSEDNNNVIDEKLQRLRPLILRLSSQLIVPNSPGRSSSLDLDMQTVVERIRAHAISSVEKQELRDHDSLEEQSLGTVESENSTMSGLMNLILAMGDRSSNSADIDERLLNLLARNTETNGRPIERFYIHFALTASSIREADNERASEHLKFADREFRKLQRDQGSYSEAIRSFRGILNDFAVKLQFNKDVEHFMVHKTQESDFKALEKKAIRLVKKQHLEGRFAYSQVSLAAWSMGYFTRAARYAWKIQTSCEEDEEEAKGWRMTRDLMLAEIKLSENLVEEMNVMCSWNVEELRENMDAQLTSMIETCYNALRNIPDDESIVDPAFRCIIHIHLVWLSILNLDMAKAEQHREASENAGYIKMTLSLRHVKFYFQHVLDWTGAASSNNAKEGRVDVQMRLIPLIKMIFEGDQRIFDLSNERD